MIDSIVLLPVDELHESPFNPRRDFNEPGLIELAESIKTEGVLEPVLVRPRLQPLFGNDPEAAAGHELVFGHRRFRAAQIAGLSHMPCMVRAMTDEEVRRAQMAENVQRDNLHALEEAEGYAAMQREDGVSIEQLVEHTGKSRSHVYARLQLLKLPAVVSKACRDGAISADVALLIARVPTPKLQEKALASIESQHVGNLEDGGKRSYRSIRRHLNERYSLELKAARWDLTETGLVPAAGACSTCPKRSGCTPELYSDVVASKNGDAYDEDWLSNKGPNICMDPDCFDAKKKAHLKREALALEAKGKTVIDGNKARQIISAQGEVKGGYVEASTVRDVIKKAKADVAIITVQDPRNGKTKQVVKIEDAKAAGVKIAAPKKDDTWQERQAREQDQDQKRRAAAKAESQFRFEVFKQVGAALRQRDRDAADLALAAQAAFKGAGHYGREWLILARGVKNLEAFEKSIAQMPAPELSAFMVECAIAEFVHVDAWRFKAGESLGLLGDVAKRCGVDVAALRNKAAGDAPAAPAKPKAVAKKKPARTKAGGDASGQAELEETA